MISRNHPEQLTFYPLQTKRSLCEDAPLSRTLMEKQLT